MPKQWTIARGRVVGPAPFLLMGILNLTPDSFSDAARRRKNGLVPAAPAKPEDAAAAAESHPASGGLTLSGLKAQALDMAANGAGVLDLGGESTRPGAAPLGAAEERARVLPALAALRETFSEPDGAAGLPRAAKDPTFSPAFSVDTYRAETARAVLEAGAEIINDISAWDFEPELKEVILERQPGYVLMHCLGRPQNMQSRPHYHNVVDQVYAFLENKLEELVRGGLPEDRVVLDPGIGFGKNLAHNLELLRQIERFYSLGRPVLLGLSYKSFLGDLLGVPVGERGPLTQTAAALMAERGVWAHRVHEVREVWQALRLGADIAGNR